MAAAAIRMRVYAVQTALGASRASLIRVGLFEGGVLLGASGLVAIMLTAWGIATLDSELTSSMRAALTNPLDVDPRVLVFMLLVAVATWLLTSLPVIWRVSRMSVVDGLRDDPRTTPATRAVARSRQLLLTGQIALTTLLLVCAMLYLRTYSARLGVDKGFDAANIATIQISAAPDAPVKGANLEAEVLGRLRVTPGVLSVSAYERFAAINAERDRRETHSGRTRRDLGALDAALRQRGSRVLPDDADPNRPGCRIRGRHAARSDRGG